MSPLSSLDLFGRYILQRQHDMYAFEDQDPILDLDLPRSVGGQLPPACADLARLQRAT